MGFTHSKADIRFSKKFEELTGIHLCRAAEPGPAAPPRNPHGSSSAKQEP